MAEIRRRGLVRWDLGGNDFDEAVDEVKGRGVVCMKVFPQMP